MDAPRVLPDREIEYPSSDGEPMAETDEHRDATVEDAIHVLADCFSTDPMVYVSGDNFIYYVEGDPRECVSPDVYVVKGVPARKRDVYKAWAEGGRLPCFVLEITSRKTRRYDLGEKMVKYRDELAVPEYFLFDPRGEWIPERLRSFRLEGGQYEPIAPNASSRFPSHQLGLELAVVEGRLRFFVPGSTEPIPTRRERAEIERERAERAEEELRRLRSQFEDRPGGS